MKIQAFVLGAVGTNCYFVTNEVTKQTIIIDPPEQAGRIREKLEDKGLAPVAILLTHGHFDHIMAASDLSEDYGIPVYAPEAEKALLEAPRLNLSESMGSSFAITPDIFLHDMEQLTIAGFPVRVLLTPGHTAGSVCYHFYEDNVLVSGDTLFFESVGRTDLPSGNMEHLLESIRTKLMCLEDSVKVYPGHGPRTTIGHERKNNPFLGRESFWD